MRQIFSSIADVIIVGGNHSGLSLAAALGSAGLRVICLERAPSPQKAKAKWDGRTVALSYRSVQLLTVAGVWPYLKPKACPIQDIRVADQDSLLCLDFHSHEVSVHPFGWIVENVLFRQALEKRLRQLPNVTVIHEASVADIDPGMAHACVRLEDGRHMKASLVVAADGRGSRCRELAGISTYGWDYHQTAIICTIAHSLPHKNVAVEHFQPGGPFATLPMTGNRSSIVWTEKTGAAAALMAMDIEDFTALLQQRVEPYLGSVQLLGQRASYPLNLQHARRYTSRRLVLVGDAAHGIHPIAGQGLNLGLSDIEVLVDELTQAHEMGLDPGDPSVLRRYEKRRRFDNGNMVIMTDLLDRLFSNAVPSVQAARRLGLGLVQNMPRLRRFFMRTAMGVGRFQEKIV